MLEKQIESPVVKWAKKQGIKVKKKVFADQLDRWFFFPNGVLVIIEFKVPGKKLTPLQQIEIEELLELGYNVEVHDDKEEAVERLKVYGRYAGVRPREVVAPQIPERFRSVVTDPRLRGAVRRSGDGQNKHYPRGFKRS